MPGGSSAVAAPGAAPRELTFCSAVRSTGRALTCNRKTVMGLFVAAVFWFYELALLKTTREVRLISFCEMEVSCDLLGSEKQI